MEFAFSIYSRAFTSFMSCNILRVLPSEFETMWSVLLNRSLLVKRSDSFRREAAQFNHTLQRTRRERRGCKRCVPCAGSLSSPLR